MNNSKYLYPYWYGTQVNPDYIETKDSDSGCKHEYVNVSFSHVILACKFCGLDKPQDKKEDSEWTD
jgi:hypothetical protein